MLLGAVFFLWRHKHMHLTTYEYSIPPVEAQTHVHLTTYEYSIPPVEAQTHTLNTTYEYSIPNSVTCCIHLHLFLYFLIH